MKRDIRSIPLEELKARLAAAKEFNVLNYKDRKKVINPYSTSKGWFYPQALAILGNLPAVKGDNGLYSAHKTYQSFNDRDKLLVQFLYTANSSQLNTERLYNITRYCTLTPFVLSAFKEYQGIGYEEWDKEETITTEEGITYKPISLFLNKRLDYALIKDAVPDWVVEAVLSNIDEYRSIHLADRDGGVKKCTSNDGRLIEVENFTEGKVYKLKGNNLALKIMLQVWCACPGYRDEEFNILDIQNWDNVPEPVIMQAPDVKKEVEYKHTTDELPW